MKKKLLVNMLVFTTTISIASSTVLAEDDLNNMTQIEKSNDNQEKMYDIENKIVSKQLDNIKLLQDKIHPPTAIEESKPLQDDKKDEIYKSSEKEQINKDKQLEDSLEPCDNNLSGGVQALLQIRMKT